MSALTKGQRQELGEIAHANFLDSTRVRGITYGDLRALLADLADAERERDEARRLVVGTAMFGSKCAYCGALVKVEDMNNFDGIALQLRRHAAKCPKHPSRAVEAQRDALRAQVAALRDAYETWTLHDCAIGKGDYVCKCCAQAVEIIGGALRSLAPAQAAQEGGEG